LLSAGFRGASLICQHLKYQLMRIRVKRIAMAMAIKVIIPIGIGNKLYHVYMALHTSWNMTPSQTFKGG